MEEVDSAGLFPERTRPRFVMADRAPERAGRIGLRDASSATSIVRRCSLPAQPSLLSAFAISVRAFAGLRDSDLSWNRQSREQRRSQSLRGDARFQSAFPAVSPEEILGMVTRSPRSARVGQLRRVYYADIIAVPAATSSNVFEGIIACDGRALGHERRNGWHNLGCRFSHFRFLFLKTEIFSALRFYGENCSYR